MIKEYLKWYFKKCRTIICVYVINHDYSILSMY